MHLTIDKLEDIFINFCTEQAIDRRGYSLDVEIFNSGEMYKVYVKNKYRIKTFNIILTQGTDIQQGMQLLKGLIEWQESLHRHPLEVMLMRQYGLY